VFGYKYSAVPIAFRMPLTRENERLLRSCRSSGAHLTRVKCSNCSTTYMLATDKIVDQNGIKRHAQNLRQQIGPCSAHFETVFM
jgi:hypothetical protein